jgi:hypothetical protein
LGINTANAMAIRAITYKLNPIAVPSEAENHMDAAVVKLVILSFASLFRIIPAPRKPTPVTIPAAILDVECGSTWADIYEKIIEPPITKL